MRTEEIAMPAELLEELHRQMEAGAFTYEPIKLWQRFPEEGDTVINPPPYAAQIHVKGSEHGWWQITTLYGQSIEEVYARLLGYIIVTQTVQSVFTVAYPKPDITPAMLHPKGKWQHVNNGDIVTGSYHSPITNRDYLAEGKVIFVPQTGYWVEEPNDSGMTPLEYFTELKVLETATQREDRAMIYSDAAQTEQHT